MARQFVISGIVAACLLSGCDQLPGTHTYAEGEAQSAVASLLIDPASAEFRSVTSFDGAVCGEVNPKNRMGAYTGFSRFVVTTDATSAIIDPKFELADLATAEDLCQSMRSNSYASVTSTNEACERAIEQRTAYSTVLAGKLRWPVGRSLRQFAAPRSVSPPVRA